LHTNVDLHSMQRHYLHTVIRILWLFGLVFGIITQPLFVRAQETVWQEQRTNHFAILYPQGSEQQAANYAQFVDQVYDELSALFSYRTPTPVPLRIYPTMDLYHQANPLAADLPGVVAHAHTGRREISVALPQTVNQNETQIANNIRHELTHIIAADLSGNKLTTAFQEGIAQYVEHPTPELDIKMDVLRQALEAGQLLSWRDIQRSAVLYENPQIGYSQSYAMVTFLINREGFTTFKRFLEFSKTSSGYRGALQSAYAVGADQLEAEWREQLPAFINGGYRAQHSSSSDLGHIEMMLARGEYTEAENELSTILGRRGSITAEQTAQLEALLQRARNGQRIASLAEEARKALETGEYAAAQKAANEGRTLLQRAQQPTQMEVMDEYAQLAHEGLVAQQKLTEASVALRKLKIEQARSYLADSYRTFTRLGDERGAEAAERALQQIHQTQSLLAFGLGMLGALVFGWNLYRRRNERTAALPFG
jgi:hypothetical protein